jgi:hypothetical protein
MSECREEVPGFWENPFSHETMGLNRKQAVRMLPWIRASIVNGFSHEARIIVGLLFMPSIPDFLNPSEPAQRPWHSWDCADWDGKMGVEPGTFRKALVELQERRVIELREDGAVRFNLDRRRWIMWELPQK